MLSCLLLLKQDILERLSILSEGLLVRTPIKLLNLLVSRGSLPATRAKDIRTSLHKLADAIASDVDNLDLTAVEPTYLECLHTYFAERAPEASASTKRNTAQNLKQFYRL